MQHRKARLNADDWCEAALDVIAESGVEALAVEPLARRLGVTKGSFYWHFTSRDALLAATLELWARQMTDDVITRVEEEPDPRSRIRRLFREVDGSGNASRLFLALSAASHDPAIRQVIELVSERGMQFLHSCYTALGLPSEAARYYTTLAYSTFLGTLQLRRDMPTALPPDHAFSAYMDFVEERLLPATDLLETRAAAV